VNKFSPWFTLIGIALGAGAQETGAQTPSLTPGSKVRVSVLGQRARFVAILQERSADSLVVALPSEGGSRRTIGLDQVGKLETWSKRRHPVGRGWARGTGIGALAGMIIGSAVEPPCSGGGGWCIGPSSTGDMVAAGLITGALMGGIIGAVVGAATPEGWTSLDLKLIRPGEAGAAVGLSWRLTLPAIRAP
jgi:hypothetical protein